MLAASTRPPHQPGEAPHASQSPLKVTQVTLDGVTPNVELVRSRSSIVFKAGNAPRTAPCLDFCDTISSTVTNTDQIVIRGTEIDESFTIDLSGGAFAPGVATEASGTPEIELVLTSSAGRDRVSILGAAANDTLRVGPERPLRARTSRSRSSAVTATTR